jgi:hypothetical protein
MMIIVRGTHKAKHNQFSKEKLLSQLGRDENTALQQHLAASSGRA